jgi:hypothetical protein
VNSLALQQKTRQSEHSYVMANILPKTPHKLGADRKEAARKARKHDPNFAQSRDIREDRGERQMKAAQARQTLPHTLRPR